MNDTTSPTRLPWSVDKCDGRVYAANHAPVGSAVDWSLIVEAVNSHARLLAERGELVAALRDLVSRADHLFLVPNDRAGTLNCAATSADIAKARALLARIEAGK